ncbi:MAG: integrase arm-type DNA-binding domain-containing protein [Rhizomicrobium sp.]|nr:integrase arm-type DNA-binding domain-containing protein [Rhizomicrobium sp.]
MDRSSSTRLTKLVVEKAETRGARYDLWDLELAGFGLRVEKSGTKSFIIRYRVDGGGRSAPRRFLAVGRYGPLTVEQARKKAKALLGAAASGRDPAGDVQEKRRESTMKELLDFYEKHGCVIQRGKHKGNSMKPQTKQNTMARLRNHVEPLLGHKRVNGITSGDIETFVTDVTEGKTAKDEKVGPRKRVIVRGGEGAARKVVRDLSAVFSFGARHRFNAKNPVEQASVRKTDNRRERFLTLEEVSRLGEAFDKVEARGANPKAIAISRLWALTGCRRNEIAELKVHEVNLTSSLFEFDDTKTGKSIRPFGPAAAALLQKLLKERNEGYLFPAERGDGYYQGTRSIWAEVTKLAKLPGVTPHTLRHTLGSTATSSGEALALTGAILGHANLRSTAIYAHVQRDPSLEAAKRVEKLLATALERKAVEKNQDETAKAGPEVDADLIRVLAERLSKEDSDATRLRAILAQVIALNT